jgi:hypothetical protein
MLFGLVLGCRKCGFSQLQSVQQADMIAYSQWWPSRRRSPQTTSSTSTDPMAALR